MKLNLTKIISSLHIYKSLGLLREVHNSISRKKKTFLPPDVKLGQLLAHSPFFYFGLHYFILHVMIHNSFSRKKRIYYMCLLARKIA